MSPKVALKITTTGIEGEGVPVSKKLWLYTSFYHLSLTDGYDINNVAYKWEESSEDGMSFVPSDMKMLPQFKLTKLQLSTLFTRYVIG